MLLDAIPAATNPTPTPRKVFKVALCMYKDPNSFNLCSIACDVAFQSKKFSDLNQNVTTTKTIEFDRDVTGSYRRSYITELPVEADELEQVRVSTSVTAPITQENLALFTQQTLTMSGAQKSHDYVTQQPVHEQVRGRLNVDALELYALLLLSHSQQTHQGDNTSKKHENTTQLISNDSERRDVPKNTETLGQSQSLVVDDSLVPFDEGVAPRSSLTIDVNELSALRLALQQQKHQQSISVAPTHRATSADGEVQSNVAKHDENDFVQKAAIKTGDHTLQLSDANFSETTTANVDVERSDTLPQQNRSYLDRNELLAVRLLTAHLPIAQHDDVSAVDDRDVMVYSNQLEASAHERSVDSQPTAELKPDTTVHELPVDVPEPLYANQAATSSQHLATSTSDVTREPEVKKKKRSFFASLFRRGSKKEVSAEEAARKQRKKEEKQAEKERKKSEKEAKKRAKVERKRQKQEAKTKSQTNLDQPTFTTSQHTLYFPDQSANVYDDVSSESESEEGNRNNNHAPSDVTANDADVIDASDSMQALCRLLQERTEIDQQVCLLLVFSTIHCLFGSSL